MTTKSDMLNLMNGGRDYRELFIYLSEVCDNLKKEIGELKNEKEV